MIESLRRRDVMSIRDRLIQWWKGLARLLDALDSGAEFDLHEEHRRRLSAIEERLHALEKSGKANETDVGSGTVHC
jgi:hypothetical protein